MKVTAQITGFLRRPDGRATTELDLPDTATAGDALAALGYDDRERRAIRVARDGHFLNPGDAVGDGDTLTIVAGFGGG